jgi:hypothetical protein
MFSVGTVSVGKTLLLKKLSSTDGEEDFHDLIAGTLPTVGVNHFEIDIGFAPTLKQRKKKGNRKVSVKELGGELAQNWSLYLKQVDKNASLNLIFVIDLNNPSAVPEVVYHLVNCLQLLQDRSPTDSSLLLVYSKVDLLTGYKSAEVEVTKFQSLLRLEELKRWYKDIDISEVSYSLFTEQGIPYIIDWIRRKAKV